MGGSRLSHSIAEAQKGKWVYSVLLALMGKQAQEGESLHQVGAGLCLVREDTRHWMSGPLSSNSHPLRARLGESGGRVCVLEGPRPCPGEFTMWGCLFGPTSSPLLCDFGEGPSLPGLISRRNEGVGRDGSGFSRYTHQVHPLSFKDSSPLLALCVCLWLRKSRPCPSLPPCCLLRTQHK